jgi:hypothetical protein
MVRGWPKWITLRISGISIPMPNALVAVMTAPGVSRNACNTPSRPIVIW